MGSFIVTERRDAVFEFVLNRPDKRNAINLDVYAELDAAIVSAGRLQTVRAVLRNLSLPVARLKLA